MSALTSAKRPTLVVVLVLALVACVDRALLREAERAKAADDFDKAAHLYRELTIQAPDSPHSPRAHYELAEIYYLHHRDVLAARDRLVKVLTDFPESSVTPRAKKLLARLYHEDLHDPESAIPLYESLLTDELDTELRRETLIEMANCHFRLGDLESSSRAYRDALSLPYHPDADTAYLRLANLEWLDGDSGEALRLLKELGRSSREPDIQRETAAAEVEVLISLGRLEDAQDRLALARSAYPGWDEVEVLEERLRAARQALDSGTAGQRLQEEQKKIRWGSNRGRRRNDDA